MPTYNYRCLTCDYTFEKVLHMADNLAPEADACPRCKQMTIKQQIVATTEWLRDKPTPPADWKEFVGNLKRSTPGAADFTTWN